MKISPINSLGRFVVQNSKKGNIKKPLETSQPPQTDTISFSASIASYLKKYNTLPDEIKKLLSPKDAINMFKNMEDIQKGFSKGVTVGQGKYSKVYENPWLDDYYFLIVQNPKQAIQTVYSRRNLGDSIWFDKDNELIQIIRAANA